MTQYMICKCDVCNNEIKEGEKLYHVYVESRINDHSSTKDSMRYDVCSKCKYNVSFERLLIIGKLE